jgi:hypothetical protein
LGWNGVGLTYKLLRGRNAQKSRTLDHVL